ncbi:hypothetical protein GMDG_06584 [Pseudogymnoascus destructans 20631-21]|uniref:Uncharacterized protein n=1 Tax=Pseudogymnoascus destructans (strain ATCC MYA-4855 / 20631-21) TaxID=658429 RepID=L8FTA0_PSED2|nr:hypothetical protein GMDG_06584 [Pseudogymnoascus destructans 20631-21]
MLGQGAIILPTILRKPIHSRPAPPSPIHSVPKKANPERAHSIEHQQGKKPIQAQPRTEPERRYRSGTGSTGSTGSTFLPPDATPARPARHRISCARVEDQQRNSEDQRGPARTSEDQQRTSRGLARAALQDGRRS